MRYVQSPNKHIIREELLEFSDSSSDTESKTFVTAQRPF